MSVGVVASMAVVCPIDIMSEQVIKDLFPEWHKSILVDITGNLEWEDFHSKNDKKGVKGNTAHIVIPAGVIGNPWSDIAFIHKEDHTWDIVADKSFGTKIKDQITNKICELKFCELMKRAKATVIKKEDNGNSGYIEAEVPISEVANLLKRSKSLRA